MINFVEKETSAKVFSCEICQTFLNTLSTEHECPTTTEK